MQPGFTTHYATTLTVDFRIFALVEFIDYTAENGEVYRMPKAARSDLASIPRPLWSLLPPAGEDGAEYGLCAFLHDLCYRNTLLRVLPDGSTQLAALPKDRCDLLLKESMELCGVPAHIVFEIYEGVRLGGQGSFCEDR
jgi:hypothetical protein